MNLSVHINHSPQVCAFSVKKKKINFFWLDFPVLFQCWIQDKLKGKQIEGLFALPKSGTKAPYLADEEKQVFPEGSATHLH